MDKFCKKCGSKIEEATGLCPKCDAEKLKKRSAESEKVRKQQKRAAKKAKKKAKQAGWSTGKQVRRFLLKCLLIVLPVVVVAVGVAGLLAYFDVVDVPVITAVLENTGIKRGHSKNECYTPDEKNIVYETENDGYVNNMVLLFAYSNTSDRRMSEIAEELGGQVIGKISGVHQYQVQIDAMSKKELEAVCKKAMAYDEVKYAMVDTVTAVETSSAYVPNDP